MVRRRCPGGKSILISPFLQWSEIGLRNYCSAIAAFRHSIDNWKKKVQRPFLTRVVGEKAVTTVFLQQNQPCGKSYRCLGRRREVRCELANRKQRTVAHHGERRSA